MIPPPRRMITHKSKEDKVKVTSLKNSPKFQFFKFWNKHYTRHTFSSCLIRWANMKWIRQVLLKIQRGHNSVHRRTDGQMDKVKPVYPSFNFIEAGGITRVMLNTEVPSAAYICIYAEGWDCKTVRTVKCPRYISMRRGQRLWNSWDREVV